MIKQNHPGVRKGFELSEIDHDIQAKEIQDTLKSVVEIANGRDGSNKAMALKDCIKSILYSRDQVEIELFLKTALPPSCNAKGNEIPASARPKMPPHIFGRAETMMGILAEKSPKGLCTDKVRSKEMAAKSINFRTFRLMIPNEVFKDKKHF